MLRRWITPSVTVGDWQNVLPIILPDKLADSARRRTMQTYIISPVPLCTTRWWLLSCLGTFHSLGDESLCKSKSRLWTMFNVLNVSDCFVSCQQFCRHLRYYGGLLGETLSEAEWCHCNQLPQCARVTFKPYSTYSSSDSVSDKQLVTQLVFQLVFSKGNLAQTSTWTDGRTNVRKDETNQFI